jgi:hypothetical protein
MLKSARVFVLAAFFVGTSCPAAWASQGGDFFHSGNTVNGTRSGVQRLVMTPGSGGVTLGSVRSQSGLSGTPSLFQIGYVKSNSTSFDCGAFSGVKLFVEESADGINYFCDTYADSNNNERLAVVKQSCCVGLWGAYQSGTLKETDYVAFDTGYVFVIGEVQSTSSDTDSLCFGCSGATTWQYTTNNGASYIQINTESGMIDDGLSWTISHAPSPINVHD